MRYPVELVADDDTVLVTSPDFPEMHTFGDDEADALAHAVPAMETAIQGRMIDRESIPDPGPIGGHSIILPVQTALKVELYRIMCVEGLGSDDLARRLGWSSAQVDRLLDVRHVSRLDQMETAFRTLGREVEFEIKTAA